MPRKKFIVLFMSLLCLVIWWDDLSHFAGRKYDGHKESREIKKEVKNFAECKDTTECMAVYGICGKWESVNKQHVVEAEEYFAWKNASETCKHYDDPMPCKHICNEKGICEIADDQSGCPEIFYNKDDLF